MPAIPSPPRNTSTDRLGLDDPSRFRTISGVPILDAHPPIRKTTKDPARVSSENPDGLAEEELEVSPEDLETIAANTNRQIGRGNPPSLQLGHTPLEDRPEAFQPKHVGFLTGFRVGELEGRPHLFADLKIMAGQYDEAMSYPRLSVERVGWDDEDAHAVDAVALIRRSPERNLPAVPYARGRQPRVCYSRAIPAPGNGRASAKVTMDAEVRYGAINNLTSLTEVRRRMKTEASGAPVIPKLEARPTRAPVIQGYQPPPTDHASIRAIEELAEARGISPAQAFRVWARDQKR